MKKPVFGRLWAPDERDSKYKIRKPKTKSIRTIRYWTDTWFWGNQQQTSECVGYGWSHWLANYPLKQYVSPTGIYKLAQHFDEWDGEDYEGTSVRAGAKVLAYLGFVKEYRWATKIDDVIQTLLETGPVVVGTSWYEGMETPDKSGLVTVTGEVRGGHCYLLTGVNTQTGLFRIKNSWGTKWGLNGRAFIRIEEFASLMSAKDSGEVCLAIETMPEQMMR